jgi:hypothetical protein
VLNVIWAFIQINKLTREIKGSHSSFDVEYYDYYLQREEYYFMDR